MSIQLSFGNQIYTIIDYKTEISNIQQHSMILNGIQWYSTSQNLATLCLAEKLISPRWRSDPGNSLRKAQLNC